MEMARGGKPGKPKAGFPRFSTRLEIAFAIPTFPQVSAAVHTLPTGGGGGNRALPGARGKSVGPCSAGVGRVITIVVLLGFLMAGFEVTTYGRFWGDH